MTQQEIAHYRQELSQQYPGATIKVAPDQCEMVAEVNPRTAIAIIERSVPHFHRHTSEVYRVTKGVLHVSSGGLGHVLTEGDSLTIEPGLVHWARSAGTPAWVEVVSDPPWSEQDHFIL